MPNTTADATAIGTSALGLAGAGVTIAGLAGAAAAAAAATAAATAATAGAIGAAAGIAGAAAADIGVGAAVGSAIPIPGLGTAIGAAVGAIIAASIAIADLTKDTFNVPAPIAEAWLTMFRLDPALLFQGVDNTGSALQAEKLVRYFRIISGEVPVGKYGNTGQLYNPNNDSCENPYMCAPPDPDEPLTSSAVVPALHDAYSAWVANGSDMRTFTTMVPSQHRAPADVRTLLGVIRQLPNVFQEVMTWDAANNNRPQIVAAIKAARARAGESGPDAMLSTIFGGDVSVPPAKITVVPYGTGTYQVAPATGQLPIGWSGAAVPLNGAMAYIGPPTAPLAAFAPAADSSDTWWNAGLGAAALALAGAAVAYAVKSARKLNAFAGVDPAVLTFNRILDRGVLDGELLYLRDGLRNMLPFHRAFRAARDMDISPTKLAESGRFQAFMDPVPGSDPRAIEPIRLVVHANGSAHLDDGRHRYLAAKAAGAQGILARVVRYDANGDIAEEVLEKVRLL